MLKRLLVFSGYNYYPSGGWGDFCGAYNNLKEAKEAGEDAIRKREGPQNDWYQVVDTKLGRVIYTEEGIEK